MARRRKSKKNTGAKILGIGLGTVLIGGLAVAGAYAWYKERGKKDELEKQVTELGAVPVTRVPTNGNGTAMAGYGG